jgi:hypothetical protein
LQVLFHFCGFRIVPIRKTVEKLQNEPLDVNKFAHTAENEAFYVPKSRVNPGLTIALLTLATLVFLQS